MQTTKSKFYITAALIGAIIFIFLFFIGGVRLSHAAPVYAESAGYTNVLDDLKKDPNFNENEFSEKNDDYSLQVIQVAESENGLLFLYVYQPCFNSKKLFATGVNLSIFEVANGTQLYNLTFVNNSDVFCKYLLKDFKVSENSTRYYNISAIYRKWENDVDGETGNDNTANNKSYQVGAVFKVETIDGEKKYSKNPTYVVNIIDPYTGYFIYTASSPVPKPGLIGGGSWEITDSHYVAFSTDWEITQLKNADVHYYYKSANGIANTFYGFDCGQTVEYGKEQNTTAFVSHDKQETVDVGDSYFWGTKKKYTFDTIQTTAEVIATEKNLTDATKENLQKRQWVLRFLTTERTQVETNILGYKKYKVGFTKVERVTVLRLEFDSNGKIYNLGAVSDTYTGSGKPGNAEEKEPETLLAWLERMTGLSQKSWKGIFIAVPILIVIAILIPIFSAIFPVFGNCVVTVLKGLGNGVMLVFRIIANIIIFLLKAVIWVILLPFRAVAALFKKISKLAERRKKLKTKDTKKPNQKTKKKRSKKQ